MENSKQDRLDKATVRLKKNLLQINTHITQDVSKSEIGALIYYLNTLSALGGLAAEMCALSVILYNETSKKSSEHIGLKVYAEELQKNLHYRLTVLQSCLKAMIEERKNS